ncbi:hypothetical protein BKA56DRAFT_681012 [Ilyonectria sp. MPI-CAGE-AT-0026]|nr:hypothetical protein BKA56DRAFT_681012 [Ilyonectria sp. MPI-CAGE-AT-0026]
MDTEVFLVEETIRLYKPLRLLVYVHCRMAIKPGVKAVESYFRNRHKTTETQLQEALTFASSTPQLHDPATNNMVSHQSRSRHPAGHSDDGGTSWQPVMLQSLTRGRHARYWIVETETETATAASAATIEHADRPSLREGAG